MLQTQWVIKIWTTTCFSLINFRRIEQSPLRKMIYSVINFAANPSNGGKPTSRNKCGICGHVIPRCDATKRVPGHVWAPPDFQHHSSLSGKIYQSQMCVWHDGLWNKFLIRWAFVICGLGAPRLRWSLVFQVVFLSRAKKLHHSLFSRDFCRAVVYQGDLLSRWTSRCFQYLLQQERKRVF